MTIVYKEQGAINKIKEILSKEKPNSILLVRGNKSYESCGAKNLIEPQLSDYNFTELSGFSKSITTEDVGKAISIIKENKVDFIIGVGGGTVLDIAKAASILHDEQQSPDEYVSGKIKPKGNNIKRLLIPTTAGTGCEITPFSVIYIGKTKYSLAHPSMAPDYTILAPELTYSLDKRTTAQTGCDALAQAIEAFWSATATEKSKQYSREAIPLILDNLKNAVNNPNPKNRKAMLIGSYLAGRAISIANTTVSHSLSYPLTAFYNIPHGHAVILTLPYFFPIIEKVTEENIQDGITLEYAKKTFKELLSILGVSNGTEARDKLLALIDEVGLETKLSDFDLIKKEKRSKVIDNIMKYGFSPSRIKKNPRKVEKGDVIKILEVIL